MEVYVYDVVQIFLIYPLNLGILLSSLLGDGLCVCYHRRYNDEYL